MVSLTFRKPGPHEDEQERVVCSWCAIVGWLGVVLVIVDPEQCMIVSRESWDDPPVFRGGWCGIGWDDSKVFPSQMRWKVTVDAGWFNVLVVMAVTSTRRRPSELEASESRFRSLSSSIQVQVEVVPNSRDAVTGAPHMPRRRSGSGNCRLALTFSSD